MAKSGRDDKVYWLDQKRNINFLLWGLYAACAVSAIAGFLYIDYGHFDIEKNFKLFYGTWGFACFVFIVFVGKLLRVIVMRDEDYYDR